MDKNNLFTNFQSLTSQSYYAIPDYQRDFSWTNYQTQTLFDDLSNLVRNPNDDGHFVGTIVTIDFDEDLSQGMYPSLKELNSQGINEKKIKHVVDGQQRLTCVSVLLKAALDSISPDDQRIINRTFSQAQSCLDYKKPRSKNRLPRLLLHENTGKFYLSEILKLETIKSDKRLTGASRINKAYILFRDQIEKLKIECLEDNIYETTDSFFDALLDTIIYGLEFVEIPCTSNNAFQIFESLNGKGLDLTAADRIKNIFLSWSPKGKEANSLWAKIEQNANPDYLVQFFSCLLFINKGERVPRRSLPDEFKKSYIEMKNNFDELFELLDYTSKIFGNLKAAKTGIDKLDRELLLDLKDLGHEQIYTMLMAPYLIYPENQINKKTYVEYVDVLTNLVVRIQVTEKSSNVYDKIYHICIEKMKDGESLEEISKYIREITKKTVKDNEFETSFAQMTFTDMKKANYYLRKIENYYQGKSGNNHPFSRTDTFGNELTVEHIIPQAVDREEWYGTDEKFDISYDQFIEEVVGSIGNLVLIYQSDNSAAGNNIYKDKINIYNTGCKSKDMGNPKDTFISIEKLTKKYPDKFTHIEVEQRAKELAQIAPKIWN